MNPLTLAFAGLGGYLLLNVTEDIARSPSVPKGIPTKFAPIGTLSQALVSNVSPKLKASAGFAGGGMPRNPFLFGGWGYNGSASAVVKATANAHGQQVDKAVKTLKKEYDSLTNDQKKSGADFLNKTLKPSPGLTGKESWESASKKIGAAIGTAAGAALCGPQCATIGAMAAGYLGKKLGPWLGEQWNELDKWVNSRFEKLGDMVKDKAGDVVSEIKSWF